MKRTSIYVSSVAVPVDTVLDQLYGEVLSTKDKIKRGYIAEAADHHTRASALLNLLEVHVTGNTSATVLPGKFNPKMCNGDAQPCRRSDYMARFKIAVKYFKSIGTLTRNWKPAQ